MFNLFDREFALHPPMMLFHSNTFEDDSELRELRKQRREWLTTMDDKIQSRRKALLQEYEANNPARYSRKYSSSHSNINGKELSETKDVVEENHDGRKSIQQKADKVEKDDGKIVDEEHVDVQLSQDKADKNKWTVTHGGKKTTLDATDSTFGEKLQVLMTTNSSATRTNDKNGTDAAKEAERDEEEEEEDDDLIEEIESENEPDDGVSTPLPTAVMQKRTSKAIASLVAKNANSKKNKKGKNSKGKKKKKQKKSTKKQRKNRTSARPSRKK